MRIWAWVVEAFFYADMVLNFFHSYRDTDKNEVIVEFNAICMNYIKGAFIIDLLACFPFQVIF